MTSLPRINIDLFVSPFCPRCAATLSAIESTATIGGRPLAVRRLNVVEHLDRAVTAGVRITPALVRDNRVLACGSLSEREIRRALEEDLRNVPDHQ